MRRDLQRGQASVEHVGLLALLALALAATVAAGGEADEDFVPRLARAILPASAETALGAADGTTIAPLAARTVVDGLLDASLEEFVAYRSSADRDPRLDYSTDGCTAPILGNSGPSYDFTEACLRHDFGYRSYGRLGLLDSDRRRQVDELFLADMRASCLERPTGELLRCLEWALTYYRGVRGFGWIPASRYEER